MSKRLVMAMVLGLLVVQAINAPSPSPSPFPSPSLLHFSLPSSLLYLSADSNILEDPMQICRQKVFEHCSKNRRDSPEFRTCITIGYGHCIDKHRKPAEDPIYKCFLKVFEHCSKYRRNWHEFTSCIAIGYSDCIHTHTKIPTVEKGKERDPINSRRDEHRF